MNQESVLILSLVLMAVIAGVFIFIASSAKDQTESQDYSDIQRKAYSFRAKLFWFFAVLGVVIAFSTTQTLPYAATRGATSDTDIEINVVGKQWYWQMDQHQAKQGDTVVFNLSSGDVNHGFGIYDSDLRLLAQTQAMPGYNNKLRFTFEKAGKYQLMCMEYCGLAHHAMISPFTITQRQEN